MNVHEVVLIRDDLDHSTQWGHPYAYLGKFCWAITQQCFENVRENLANADERNWFQLVPKAGSRLFSCNYHWINRFIDGFDQDKWFGVAYKADDLYMKLIDPRQLYMKYHKMGVKKSLNEVKLEAMQLASKDPEYATLQMQLLSMKYTEEALMEKMRQGAELVLENSNNLLPARIATEFDYWLYDFTPEYEYIVSGDYELVPIK